MTLIDNESCPLIFNENEVCVTWFFMTGMTLEQIAEWTGLSKKSVSYYKRRVMRKIGVKNNNEFIIWFLGNRHSYQSNKIEFSILRRSVPIDENS